MCYSNYDIPDLVDSSTMNFRKNTSDFVKPK